MFKFDYVYKVYVPVDALSKEDFEHLDALMVGHFGGFTRYVNTEGAWRNNNKKIYMEKCHVYEICLDRDDWARHFQHVSDFIMGNSKEQCVLITKSPIEMNMYYRKDYHD